MTDNFTSLYIQIDNEMKGESNILITIYPDSEGVLYCELNTPGVAE